MTKPQRILLLDDDEDLLLVYQEILRQLPSKPEVQTAANGSRALALLNSRPFNLLLSDLNMPKMDGLQVLSIVRRRYPSLRTAVLTGLADEQFRARAYGMGIDLFLEKPTTEQETRFFLDCVESLLGRDASGEFRGVQSKTLLDLVQLECLSQSSSTLKIVNGASVGRIWFENGEIIDAEAPGLAGEEAFKAVLGWKTGSFEVMPPDSKRERRITTSHHGLLLDFAQAQDEAGAQTEHLAKDDAPADERLVRSAGVAGVEFVLAFAEGESDLSMGVEDPEAVRSMTLDTLSDFAALGERLNAGELRSIAAQGLNRHLSMEDRKGRRLCVGFHRSLDADALQHGWNTVTQIWDS